MRVSGQYLAFGGIVLLAGMLAQTVQAQTYGSQWRPAGGAYAPGPAVHSSGFRRVANVPSFRPRARASSHRYSSASGVSRYQRPARSMPRRHAPMPMMAGQVYRPYAPPSPGVWSAMPTWANPFVQMGQTWRNPMPHPAGQYAWRPVQQPWFAQGQQPLRQPAPARRYLSDRQHGYAPAWRPSRRNATPATTLRTVASYRPTPSVHGPMRPQTVGTPARVPVQAAPQWRPQYNVAVSQPRSQGFRPVAYGRSVPDRVVAHNTDVHIARPGNTVPGWATTYQESAVTDSCFWCNGS